MAKKFVFAVYDSKAEVYMNPFLMLSKGEAIRGFIDLANDEKTVVCKHPEDFSLFHLGYFDDSRGVYENTKVPLSLGSAHEFKSRSVSDVKVVDRSNLEVVSELVSE